MGMAVLNGWCNFISGHAPPLLWTDIAKNSTNMEDCHRIIERAVTDTARNQGLEICKFYTIDNMLNNVIKFDFAPGWGLLVFVNL